MRYAALYPANPTTSPPSIGPTSVPVVMTMEFSALAAGRCSGGSSLRDHRRAGRALSAWQMDWRAMTAYRNQTFATPAKVPAESAAESAAEPSAL